MDQKNMLGLYGLRSLHLEQENISLMWVTLTTCIKPKGIHREEENTLVNSYKLTEKTKKNEEQ